MKRLNIALLSLALLASTACSNNKKKAKNEIVQQEQSSSLGADFIVDAEGDLFFDDQFSFEESSVASAEPMILDESDYHKAQQLTPAFSSEGKFAHYTAQEGETLMLIAFSIYGDYRKWKELKEWNHGANLNNLKAGTVIQYIEPEHKFAWRPSGLPHLVKRGETLGSISDDKYGTVKRWRDIYENNQPLIRDPNLIFAGFTLYYVPDRDIASERY